MTIFVDTNYFLRYFLKDIPEQGETVCQLFKEASMCKVRLISNIVTLFEVYWSLGSYYHKTGAEIKSVLEKILKMSFIEFDNFDLVKNAVQNLQTFDYDLEDSYHFTYACFNKAQDIATFDKKLKRKFANLVSKYKA